MRWYLIVVTDLLRRINKSLQKKIKKHACMKNPTCNMVEVFELEEAFGSWYKCLLRERRSLVREFSNVRSQYIQDCKKLLGIMVGLIIFN